MLIWVSLVLAWSCAGAFWMRNRELKAQVRLLSSEIVKRDLFFSDVTKEQWERVMSKYNESLEMRVGNVMVVGESAQCCAAEQED